MCLCFPFATNATLIGSTVTCDGSGLLRCAQPGQSSSSVPYDATNVVGVGSEFSINNINELNIFSVDISESSFTIAVSGGFAPDLSGFGSLSLRGLNWLGMSVRITGVSLITSGVSTSAQPNTDGTSLDLNDVSFGDDFVTWNMSHTHWAIGSYATFSLKTNYQGVGVPEPSILVLISLGLVCLGISGCHKTNMS